MNKGLLYLLSGFGFFIADRASKMWAYQALQEKSLSIFQGFQCELVWNRGVSFGTLQFESGCWRGLLTLFIVSVVALVLFHTIKSYRKGECIVGEILVLAGAASNLVDRFLYGAVLDFIDLSVGPWHWYTFNLADAWIVVGAVIIAYKYLMVNEGTV